MKTASIISIGSELMKGKMDDTNSTFISRWLYGLGIQTKLRISIEDGITEIVRALDVSNDLDIIILTGGLGPTDDDLTREAVSKFTGRKLIFDEESWESIKKIFLKRFGHIPESNKKQAYIFSGAESIPNRYGTAPGIFYRDENHIIVLLPGPPVENQLMIKDYLFKKFSEAGIISGNIYNEIIRVYNIGESTIADLLKEFKTECTLGYYFSQEGWIEIHVTKQGNDTDENEAVVEASLRQIKNIFDENGIYYTENKDLSLILLEKFMREKLTISFAESITGGNLSGEFVKNPGASNPFLGSVVVYSNESKTNVLGVKNETLQKFGAVSEETVKEMSEGLDKIFKTDISLSVSGIAGPSGGTEEKPVGLTWFCFKVGNNYFTRKEFFFGTRYRIIKRVINFAFIEILKYLE